MFRFSVCIDQGVNTHSNIIQREEIHQVFHANLIHLLNKEHLLACDYVHDRSPSVAISGTRGKCEAIFFLVNFFMDPYQLNIHTDVMH